jgi:hypothetical protein
VLDVSLRWVRFCEGMLGRRKLTLDGLEERTRVHVLGTVASPNLVASPITPVRAAALDWAFVHRHEYERKGQTRYAFDFLGGGMLGDEIVIEVDGLTVALPLSAADVRFVAPVGRNATSLSAPPPPPLDEIYARDAGSSHETLYAERFLSHGDRVALRCTVEPFAQRGQGPYRGERATTDFRALADVEDRPRLQELLDPAIAELVPQQA